MITPELEKQLEAAEKTGKSVVAVVILKPTVKASKVPKFVRDLLASVKDKGEVGQFTIFEKLGSFSITASPAVLRAIDGNPEVWRLTPNQG
jgi:hypothetical protein